MKQLLIFLLAFALTACAKKEWSKKYVYDDCLKEMKKDKQAMEVFTAAQGEKICDCAAGKMFVKYKSESEAKKDKSGAEDIGRECAMEVLGGNK